MSVETSIKNHQDIQTEYDKIFAAEGIRDEDRAYRWFAKRVFSDNPSATALLDLACGAGYFMRDLNNVYGGKIKLKGCDISPKALEIAAQNCPSAVFSQSVAEKLPYRDAEFDVLTCLGSFEHFLDLNAALSEIRRVTKKGALIYIMVPNIVWYKDLLAVLLTKSRKVRNQTHERFASYGEWLDLFKGAGLTLVRSIKYNGIAKYRWKQFLKDLLVPERFSYHFVYILKN